MSDAVCLLDEVGESGYQSSIVTTFAVHLPFYESVVLPKLLSSGCRHNVVMVDANQCEAALRDPSSRPAHAGREYALLPVRPAAGRGAFHPKVLLMAGPKKAKLLVGSHNLTVAGFTSNRELTNRFLAEPKGPSSDVDAVRQGLQLVRAWAADQSAEPRQFVEAAQREVSWLSGLAGSDAEARVVGAGFAGPALWDLIHQQINRRVRRILVLGAFFDESLEFLRTVQQAFRPSSFVVGLEPSSVAINPKAAASTTNMRFVDASALAKKSGYLHAKAIGFELDNGEEVFVCGSANPSAPAWLASRSDRNVEAIVVRRSRPSASLLEKLELANLFDLDGLESSAWDAISERRERPEREAAQGSGPVLAYLASRVFSIPAETLPSSALKESEFWRKSAKLGSVGGPFPTKDKRIHISLPDGIDPGLVSLLLLRCRSGQEVCAIPWDQRALSSRAQTTTQKALREAVSSLEANVPQLEALLKLVERVIFDGGQTTEMPPSAASGPRKKTEQTDEEVDQHLSLAADLDSLPRRHALARKRILSDNLVVLLDILIYNLSKGLPGQTDDDRGTAAPIEEELVGQEEPPEPPADVDGYELAALCRRKVKTLLLRRLVPHLRLAPDELQSQAFHVACQAAAVLSLTKALASLEKKPPAWLPRWTSLVDPDSQGDFVLEAAHLFCDPELGVLPAALRNQNIEAAEEVSVVRGLLLWYAWAGGIDLKWATEGEDREEVAGKLLSLGSLLCILLDSVDDPAARRFAHKTLVETCEPRRLESATAWLRRNVDWGLSVKAARPEMGDSASSTSAMAVAGSLVLLNNDTKKRPFLVVEVFPGRVHVADPWRADGVRKLGAEHVRVLSVRPVSAKGVA